MIRRVMLLAVLLLGCEDAPTVPPNRAPTAGQIPVQTLHVGERGSLDLSGFFADPDGDALTYAAVTGQPRLVTVAVSGAILELAALLQGEAEVTVTASDPEGLTASSSVRVVIPNRSPVVADTLADRRLPGPGRAVVVDVSGVFSDPDGDSLAISAESGDTSVVAVSLSVDTLTLTGGSAGGRGEVTLTARDPEGAEAIVTLGVVVNRRPLGSVEIPAQTLWHGATRVDVDLTGAFSDPDGDELTYEAASSNTEVVPVELHPGPVVSLAGPVQGEATITVTARDPDGNAGRLSFTVTVVENPDRAALGAFWYATDGPNWQDLRDLGVAVGSENWVSDASLGDWHGVAVNQAGRVICLGRCGGGRGRWFWEGLRNGEEMVVLGGGRIPPEVGNLDALERLWIAGSRLDSGEIPPEVGNLAHLEQLSVSGPNLRIPPELAELGPSLRVLYVAGSRECSVADELGSLPHLTELVIWNCSFETLGNLSSLTWLSFRMSGSAPRELGNLVNLQVLQLATSGPLPPELGNLTKLETLSATGSRGLRAATAGLYSLSGHLPPQLGNLKALKVLRLDGNQFSGVVPGELRDLPVVEQVRLDANEELCADSAMRAWLEEMGPRDSVPAGGGVRSCDHRLAGAYLLQSVQSRESPVPLVAGRDALLRVFTMSAPVTARFYLDGNETHVVEIPRFYFDAASDVQGDDVDLAATAMIPGSVIQTGLEMVIEGEAGRIPVTGRQGIEVREVPDLNLTVIPFLRESGVEEDSVYIAFADSMAADPQGFRLLAGADLLPVATLQVTSHAPVVTELLDPRQRLTIVKAIRRLEGGTGYWMGLGRADSTTGISGIAVLGGWVSYSKAAHSTIAHELGHNFGLKHAPGAPDPDPRYPYRDGRIGNEGVVKGFIRRMRRLVDSSTRDLMGYGGVAGISEYHFTKALENRLHTGSRVAITSSPVQSLLLWGGTDGESGPHLEPAFIVDAPPSLPESDGPWTIEGRDAGGRVLFTLPFAMPEIADAGEGAGGFAYTLPVRPGWQALASVTLSGPGGTATLDESTDRPMSIYRDGDGKVRAILQGDPVQANGAPGQLAGVALDVVTSRGIPSPAAWRR